MLELPAGVANTLQTDIDRLIEELRSAIPAALESDDYRALHRANRGDLILDAHKVLMQPYAWL